MKVISGVLAGLMLLAAAAPADAQRAGGGFHGGGGHGGGFHGGGFHGGGRGGGFHGGHFHGGGFYGAPFLGFGLGLGLGYGYGYPWYGYGYPAYYSSYTTYSDYPQQAYPPESTQPNGPCGTWIWHPETYSYGWLACGARSEINVPMGPPPGSAAPPAQP